MGKNPSLYFLAELQYIYIYILVYLYLKKSVFNIYLFHMPPNIV